MGTIDLLCSRNARPEKALVGRAQWEINRLPIPEERTSELGGIIYSLGRRPQLKTNRGTSRGEYKQGLGSSRSVSLNCLWNLLFQPMILRTFCNSLLLAALIGCDVNQTVSITTEDFRFVPDLVQVEASSPLTLSIYNAGREEHEFDSPILMYVAKRALPKATDKSASSGIVLPPGQSLQIVMAPPPGTYLYICRRKGHANMTGTLVVN